MNDLDTKAVTLFRPYAGSIAGMPTWLDSDALKFYYSRQVESTYP
jgi:hypothetical protein